MSIDRLRLAHWKAGSLGAEAGNVAPDVFQLVTCQRRIVAWLEGDAAPTLPGRPQRLAGRAAYGLLLEFATGLMSAFRGEADVLGQFRHGVTAFGTKRTNGPLVTILQHVITDSKAVRTAHLSTIGHATYARAVGHVAPKHADAVFVAGAGDLGASMLSKLKGGRRLIWNRTPDKARSLVASHPCGKGWSVVADDVLAALAASTLVVICVPVDGARDGAWFEAWRAVHGADPEARFVHLGERRSGKSPVHAAYVCLDDLESFVADEAAENARHLRAAEKACVELSILRSIPGAHGSQAHVAHGWEDLAAFS